MLVCKYRDTKKMCIQGTAQNNRQTSMDQANRVQYARLNFKKYKYRSRSGHQNTEIRLGVGITHRCGKLLLCKVQTKLVSFLNCQCQWLRLATSDQNFGEVLCRSVFQVADYHFFNLRGMDVYEGCIGLVNVL